MEKEILRNEQKIENTWDLEKIYPSINDYQKDFDKGENRDSGYIYGPMMPRSLFAGIKIKI